jgi:signal transduction histidine kinase
MGAGAAVILMFAAGMAASVHRFEALSTAQVLELRAREYGLTLAERLSWSGELIVSSGRGYLISGQPEMLERLHQAESTFDGSVRELRNEPLTPREKELVGEVERSVATFRRIQQDILAARANVDPEILIRRFELELLPLRRELEGLRDRLVDANNVELERLYRQSEIDRRHEAIGLYGFLAVLVFMSVGITWFFVKKLTQAYRTEGEALDAARKALAARDELMGMVAHDLRNPLGAIAMKAALLRRTAESAKTRERAESIENVTRRMEYLIKSMLDVTTMEAGRFSVTPTRCDVESLLHETVEMFENLAASKQIRFEQIEEEPGLAVHAERERVLQVLSNLLGNALKFTPPGGKVVLVVARQDDAVRFTVSDTGPGIPAHGLPHIFERFWKAETRGKTGTGLGLFIAKRIVEAHSGQIWAESAPGGGASLSFTLPIANAELATVRRVS